MSGRRAPPDAPRRSGPWTVLARVVSVAAVVGLAGGCRIPTGVANPLAPIVRGAAPTTPDQLDLSEPKDALPSTAIEPAAFRKVVLALKPEPELNWVAPAAVRKPPEILLAQSAGVKEEREPAAIAKPGPPEADGRPNPMPSVLPTPWSPGWPARSCRPRSRRRSRGDNWPRRIRSRSPDQPRTIRS
jgi:hypothetical protein